MPPTHDDVLAATVPHDPLARLAAIATTLAPLPATPLDVPSPVDEHGAAASSPDSNSNQPEVPEPASASVLDGGPGSPARPVTFFVSWIAIQAIQLRRKKTVFYCELL